MALRQRAGGHIILDISSVMVAHFGDSWVPILVVSLFGHNSHRIRFYLLRQATVLLV